MTEKMKTSTALKRLLRLNNLRTRLIFQRVIQQMLLKNQGHLNGKNIFSFSTYKRKIYKIKKALEKIHFT